MRTNSRLACLFATSVSCLLLTSNTGLASVLYTENAGWLHSVNQLSGDNERIGSCSCNYSVDGLAWRPGDRTHLFGVVNNFVQARLTRIDVRSGHRELFPFFSDSILGTEKMFATGIAISPVNSSVAIVTGWDAIDSNPTYRMPFLWHVDLMSGEVLDAPTPMSSGVRSITYTLDAAKVYGVDDNGRLVTLDPTTGVSAVIGDPGLSDFIVGLAFRPEDGALFAIDGGVADNVVVLNPLDGSVVATLGSVHLGGASGLAFIVPEPISVVLLATAPLAMLSRRRRSVIVKLTSPIAL